MRKRADQAYKAYKLTCEAEVAAIEEKMAAIEKEIAKPRLAAARKVQLATDKKELVESKKKLIQSEISHFDFLEDVAGYHIITVCSLATDTLTTRTLSHAPQPPPPQTSSEASALRVGMSPHIYGFRR